MKPGVIARSIVAFIFLLMLSGCGGGGSVPVLTAARTTQTPPPPTPAATTPTPAPVVVSPISVSLAASETQQFTATVTNASNSAVTWSVECTAADCGTITAAGLYTAPALLPAPDIVWVYATLPDNSYDGVAIVRYLPLVVELSPSVVSMAAGTTENFTALVSRHLNRDVTWSLSGSGCSGNACGTLVNITAESVTYNAPATFATAATAIVTATSVADSSKSRAIKINMMPVSEPPSGRYAFLFRDADSATIFAASLVVDGRGNLSGIGDLVNASGAHANQAFTGTYSLGGDGRGAMQITGAGVNLTLRMVMESGNFGRLLDFSGTSNGDGWLEKQNESAFSSVVLAGKHAYLLTGRRAEGSVSHVGWLEFDSSCKIIGNYSTMNDPAVRGHYVGGGSFGWGTIDAGYCTVDATTGRGTLTATDRWLDTLPDIFFYVIDANRAVAAGDVSPGSLRLSGTMERMAKNEYAASDFRGDYTFYRASDAGVAVGRITAGDGPDAVTAALSAGMQDEVQDTRALLDTSVTGKISDSWCNPACYLNSDFSMIMTTAQAVTTESYVAPVSPGKFYFIGDGHYGEAYLQEGGPFSESTFTGNLGLQLFGRDVHAVGLASLAPPIITGQVDVSWNGLSPDATMDGTISFVSGDRANVSLSTGATGTLPFRAYVISPKKLLLISTMPGQVTTGWLEKKD